MPGARAGRGLEEFLRVAAKRSLHPCAPCVPRPTQSQPFPAKATVLAFESLVVPSRAKMVDEQARPGSQPRPRGEMAAAISTGLVQLHRQYYGKGPTKAKTYFVNDTVVCILEGGFTTVERTLIEDGQSDAVYEIRRSFQKAMEVQFTEVVERATSRSVIAYMSQIHEDPDLAVELFVLEPSPEPLVSKHEAELGEETDD
jgi:uncharacterized protein YbcI